MIKVTFDSQEIESEGSGSLLETALAAGIYIPHLCSHPQLDTLNEMKSVGEVYQGGNACQGEANRPFEGCNLCLVEIEGRDGLFQSCKTQAEDGLVVRTRSTVIEAARRESMVSILNAHPHTCIFCKQGEGCDRKTCSNQIPEEQRCCFRFGNCELQKVVKFVGVEEEALSRYTPLGIPIPDDDPLLARDYNLCIGCLRCVRVCKEIKGADALGFTVADGRVVVGSKKATARESGCEFCGFCIEVCPTGALRDREKGTGRSEKRLVPCKFNCPAEIDIPHYIRLIQEGQLGDALKVIGQRVPLPGVLGRVCPHPCEAECRRGKIDDPVSICALKRTAADHTAKQVYSETQRANRSGKRVAIVGSGPAGLSAAFYLNGLGHSVTVFETLPVKGGMLRVGIPAYRLPREVLDEEIEAIEKQGVEILTNHRIAAIDELFSQGYRAAFVATGSHKGVRLGVPGDDFEGVTDGVTFLRDLALGNESHAGASVAIIGGGNVAVDSARSAIRKGAGEVTIFYRRTAAEMPAYVDEVKAASDEGIKIEYQVSPKGIERTARGLEVEFIRMAMGESDASGRRRPVPVNGSEFKRRFDTVIPAIGQESEVLRGLDGVRDAALGGSSNGDGIFLGGDFVTGPKTVVEAVASGRANAILIDRFLGGAGIIGASIDDEARANLRGSVNRADMNRQRCLMPHLTVEERAGNFCEVDRGLGIEAAEGEAQRCLKCDLRLSIREAILPPERWTALTVANVLDVPEVEGVYVLYDGEKTIYQIAGTENLRSSLLEALEDKGENYFFTFEIDPMFTSRERQLIQKYLTTFGKLPPGSAEDDDLF